MNIGHIFSYRNWVVLLCFMFGVKEKFDFFCDTLLKLGDIRINQSLVGKSTFLFPTNMVLYLLILSFVYCRSGVTKYIRRGVRHLCGWNNIKIIFV